ncbi:MAG: glycosyltransferase, partial [Planctomycetota bacterium]
RDDFARRYPESNVPVFVLHFVAPAREDDDLPEIDEVLEAHGISEPFLHVPNQLWAHKNHRVVLEALRVLRDRGTCPLVISTGQTEDYRDASFAPGFFGRLRDAGLEERFRFLGLIAYKDMATLMRHSIAMVNPSLFEGWSTTVEEAKSLGKRLLLSDIPVHREQDPERGEFFDPSDAEGLAEKITAAVAAHDAEEERREREKAESALPGRMRAFGEDYQRIVHAVVGGRR